MTEAPSPKEALELKPCPFCGGQPVFGQGGEPEHVTIGCNNDGCLVQLYVVSDTEPNAVEAWNTHATFQPADERREAIARAIAAYNEVWNGWTELEAKNVDECREEAMKAALLASGLMQNEAGWRDISTAPKDKIDGITARRVLLANTHGSMFIGYWSAEHDCWQDTSTHERVFSVATHWMPLPTPPIRSARNGGGS